MMRARVALLGLTLIAVAPPPPGSAQNLVPPEALEHGGMDASAQELEAWAHSEARRYIRARELAERVLAADPSSFVAQLVLGHVQHYAEANLPRALFHLQRARALYEGRFGERPSPDGPWRWHAELLKELSAVHGAMEHHGDKLDYIARYNELYEPDMIAERAWPLMKLGRYTEARLAAELGLQDGSSSQRVIALNALCAIEFEAGNDGASYEACKRAVEDGMERYGYASAVDLTNLAEASRSLFKLAEAERISLDATTAPLSWYGNPWMELAELYVREARFGEALSALREVPAYRAKRPPHVQHADRNETRRVLASFLLVLGRAEQAREITARALSAPDRRAHNSRDIMQDRSVLALLDRRASRVRAELLFEHAATVPFYERPLHWAKALWARLQGRRSAALVQRMLDDDDRLVGALRIGTASAAVMPPWLVGELTDVVGAGVVGEALRRASAADIRPEARPYYTAMSAEVAFTRGEMGEALRLAEQAVDTLGRGEALTIARTLALAADAARQLGDHERALRHYAAVFHRDPGIFRRMELPLAVRIEVGGGAEAEALAVMLERSPRFVLEDQGLLLRVQSERLGARVCLERGQGDLIACADVEARSDEDSDAFAARAARGALEQLFSPRIDLTQFDINSLDGGNLAGSGKLDDLFEQGAR